MAKNYRVKKGQAVRGQKIKKRNISKYINRAKDVVDFIWKPKIITAVSLIVLVVIAYSNTNVSEMLPIQSVKIEGEFQFLDKNKLRQKAVPVVKGGFFNVDLPAVRNALIDLPWVEDVSVRRIWPDQLLVRVIEKLPVVYWGDKGVISSKGKLFMPEKKLTVNMPHLSGPQGQHKSMLKELARMQAWLIETGLRIQTMQVNERRSWILTMTTGMELRLGREQMHERLNRFVSVYKDTLQTEKREIKHIDMRYTNGFAVAWKEA